MICKKSQNDKRETCFCCCLLNVADNMAFGGCLYIILHILVCMRIISTFFSCTRSLYFPLSLSLTLFALVGKCPYPRRQRPLLPHTICIMSVSVASNIE